MKFVRTITSIDGHGFHHDIKVFIRKHRHVAA